jgi:glycosyltransferase involved in cell wall biosynthesis
VDTALAQDFSGIEIIVIDDGSTDATRKVLDAYGTKLKIIERPNGGQSAARNTGIASARGKYLAFLDADDYWLPGRIRMTVEALEGGEAGLALCDYLLVDREDGGVIGVARPGRAPDRDEIFEAWPTMTPTSVTMRADLARECGGFPEGIGWGEDVILWIAAIHRRPFEYVSSVLAAYSTSDRLTERKYTIKKRRPFERELTTRYGAKARTLVAIARRQYASLLLASALTDLKNGRKLRGIRDLAALLGYRPSYLMAAAWQKINLPRG